MSTVPSDPQSSPSNVKVSTFSSTSFVTHWDYIVYFFYDNTVACQALDEVFQEEAKAYTKVHYVRLKYNTFVPSKMQQEFNITKGGTFFVWKDSDSDIHTRLDQPTPEELRSTLISLRNSA